MADITQNLVFSSESITNLPDILLHLIQENIISESEEERIRNKDTSLESINELWVLMQTRNSEESRKLFLGILRKTQNEHWADVIEGVSKGDPEESMQTEVAERRRLMVEANDKSSDESSSNNTIPLNLIRRLNETGSAERLRTPNKRVLTWKVLSIVSTLLVISALCIYVFFRHMNKTDPIIQENTVDQQVELGITSPSPKRFYTEKELNETELLDWNKKHPDLQVFVTKDSAVKFFYKSLGLTESPGSSTREHVEKLCKKLRHFPLAMNQAAAYINEKLPVFGNLNAAIKDYLNEIKIISRPLILHKLPRYDALDDVSKTVFLTSSIIFDKLRESKDAGELAMDIINTISFLSPDNIPTKMVRRMLHQMGKVSDGANIDKFFELIRKYSMINYSYGNLISVNELVQEVTRIDLERRGEFQLILSKIGTLMKDMLREEEIALKDLFHVQMVWKHLSRDKQMMEKHTGLPWSICNKLSKSGKFMDLVDFSNKTADLLESVFGHNNRWTLQLKHWTGEALSELGEYSESLEILSYVFEMQKEIFGETDVDCLITAEGLGRAYQQLKKYEQALETYKNALQINERIFGREHHRTLNLKNNIALVLIDQNKLEEALEVYQEILEVDERLLGVEHPDTVTTKYNIASIKLDLMDYPTALKEFQEILEIEERILEINHPNTLRTKFFIAKTYYNLGRYQESLQLFHEVHEGFVQVLGSRHPETINTGKWIVLVEREIT